MAKTQKAVKVKVLKKGRISPETAEQPKVSPSEQKPVGSIEQLEASQAPQELSHSASLEGLEEFVKIGNAMLEKYITEGKARGNLKEALTPVYATVKSYITYMVDNTPEFCINIESLTLPQIESLIFKGFANIRAGDTIKAYILPIDEEPLHIKKVEDGKPVIDPTKKIYHILRIPKRTEFAYKIDILRKEGEESLEMFISKDGNKLFLE